MFGVNSDNIRLLANRELLAIDVSAEELDLMLLSREEVAKETMECGGNIRFGKLGTFTINPTKFQRFHIKQELFAKYGKDFDGKRLNELLKERMHELSVKGEIVRKKVSKIRKTVKTK